MMMISGHGSGGGEDPSTSTTPCPPWKLYHNPFFFYKNPIILPLHNKQQLTSNSVEVIMRAKIEELTAALEHERRVRRKSEHLNKRLAKELCKERRGREALERVCEELAKEISSIDKMKKEMEEERRMLRMAEVLREERVQMKLAEAKIFLEEKMSLLEMTGRDFPKPAVAMVSAPSDQGFKTRKPRRAVLGEKVTSSDDNVINKSSNKVMVTRMAMRAAAESETAVMKLGILRRPPPENPHIKRGIKGFVEFPRVVRTVGSKSRYHWGTKLECQKAQIRLLLKQRSPLRSDHHLI